MGASSVLGLAEFKTVKLYRAVAAEFCGTMFFVLCVTNVANGWVEKGVYAANHVEIGLGVGLAIATLAQAFGHVSGGHLNPAVTLGMVVARKVSIVRGVLYVLAQMLGAIVGAAITWSLTPAQFRGTLACNELRSWTGSQGTDKISIGQGFGAELLFTFILVFFIFSVTDEKKKTEPYGTTLGIGVCILVAHVCIIPFTNCSINPARSFGTAVVANYWPDHWIFWAAPMLGGVLAALAYEFLFFYEVVEEKPSSTRNGNVVTLEVRGNTNREE